MSPIDDSWAWQNLISRTIVGYKQKGKINKHSNASRCSWYMINRKTSSLHVLKRAIGSSMVCSLWSCYRGSVWQLAPAHAEKMSIWASALNPNVMSMPIVSSVSNVINEPGSFGPGAKKYLPSCSGKRAINLKQHLSRSPSLLQLSLTPASPLFITFCLVWILRNTLFIINDIFLSTHSRLPPPPTSNLLLQMYWWDKTVIYFGWLCWL